MRSRKYNGAWNGFVSPHLASLSWRFRSLCVRRDHSLQDREICLFLILEFPRRYSVSIWSGRLGSASTALRQTVQQILPLSAHVLQ